MIDPNSSDWSDLDLLTFSEVHERLAHEISVVESELGHLDHATPDADTERSAEVLRARLNALKVRLGQ